MEKFLLNAEADHPDNEKHISQLKDVLIPDTGILKQQVEALQKSANELYNALELPELIIHSSQGETMEYTKRLLINYFDNKEKVNGVIEQAAQRRDKEKKWKVERMVRLDRDILRVATTELLYFSDVPTEVVCDEAVKAAEKYGSTESKKFVNGVLRDLVELARLSSLN